MFAKPWLLLLLLLIVPIVYFYIFSSKWFKPKSFTHTNPMIIDKVNQHSNQNFKHIPFVLSILGVAMLIIALAGPLMNTQTAKNRSTVVLVFDTSISMESKDVAPTRIQAAEIAAKNFVNDLPSGVNVGVISFNSGATILTPPIDDKSKVNNLISGLKLNYYTATGKGISTALDMIDDFDGTFSGNSKPQAQIILLSDGKETVPSDPNDTGGEYVEAKIAKEKGIPINTIAFGTAYGTIQLPPDYQTQSVPYDPESLAKVAEISGGKTYKASSIDELNSIYNTLKSNIGYQKAKEQDPKYYLIAALFFLICAAITGPLLNTRVP